MHLRWYEQSRCDLPGQQSWLNEWERIHASRLRIPKRRTDWLLGRWTAKRAVAASLCLADDGRGLTRIEVWPLPSGAPRLFVDQCAAGFSISLTHCHDLAACVVGPASMACGCDIEAIELRTEAFIADYFSNEEQAAAHAASQQERDRLITLIWSAKESALKALGIGLRIDTRSLTVTMRAGKEDSDAAEIQTVAAHGNLCWQPLWIRFDDGRTWSGSWCSDETHVRTVVATSVNDLLH